MVGITAELFWYRTKEWFQIMADKVNDIVYTDETKETVNVINLMLLGWILLGLVVYIIGNIVASHLRRKKSILAAHKSESADDTLKKDEHVSFTADTETKVENVSQEPQKLDISRVVIPTCEGDEPETIEWINNLFFWIYNQCVVSPILDAWLSALNARTRLSSTEHGILVDFKDVIHASSPSKVTNVLQSSSSKCDTCITCDTEIEDVSFDILVTQFKEKEKIKQPFVLNVKRIAGKAYIECMPEDVSFDAKYSEVPQIQLSVDTSERNKIDLEDIQPLSDLVCEIATEALSSAKVHLRLTCFPECPRLLQKSADEVYELEATEEDREKKLLVKIIKASNLGGSKGCLKPYCIVEMDEPPQRFETRCIEEKHNPFWDESYTFIVKDISAELLFEVYDKEKPSNENFLGLGIVSVDELLRNPSQRQMIPLQSRPLENDNVTGTLTAEFLFLNQTTPVSETTHLSQLNVKDELSTENGKLIETNSRITAGGTVITTTTIKRTNEESIHSLEPTSNLHANSLHFANNNLIPIHEVSEPYVNKENITNGFPSKVSNGCSKISNGSLNNKNCSNGQVSNLSILYKNQTSESNELSNVTALNKPVLDETNKKIIADAICNVEEKTDAVENDISLIACSPVHVHDVPVIIPKPPIIVVDESGDTVFQNGSPFKGHKNSLSKEIIPLHDRDLNVENSDLESKDNSKKGDLNPELEAIIEIVEFSPIPPEVSENTDKEADLAGAALKEIEKLSKPNSTSKSTLIIHSVQRPNNFEALEASPASQVSKDSYKDSSYSESLPSSPTPEGNSYRSRPKEKKSFMGTIRRKLSFHKARSKSVENRSEAVSTYSQASSRSASNDRVRHLSNQKQSPFKERLLGQFLNVPGSTRSSISEASGISGISTRTYVNENSTLVIETNENGIIKRYLIPNSLVHRSKWKKRGTKLHIYNDHVFIAKHLSGSTLCQVCQKSLTRRPGKQGYECRGCNLQCHKTCHVKVENFCSNSSVNSMEVEYIQDPKGSSPKSI